MNQSADTGASLHPGVFGLRDVAKSVGTTSILSDVSMDIFPGEAVALMGPSGSGKSTVMAVLGMFTSWNSGSVTLDGVGIGSSARSRNRARQRMGMGWIGQHAAFLPGRSVVDNVLVPLRVGTKRPENMPEDPMAEAIGLLESLGLGSVAFSSASVLSGGEQQRLSIARAIVCAERVVLADEPTASLDSVSTELAIEALVSSRAGKTLVVATHDPRVAERCERTVWLRDGVVEKVDG